MIVSHLKLRNWRNFTSVDVDLSDRVFLVGPNASGKSNFLDVFRFLRDIAKEGGGLQRAVKDRGGLPKIRCLAARKHPDVEIEVHLANGAGQAPILKYSIGIKLQPSGHRKPLLAYERIWRDGQWVLNRPYDDDREDSLRLTQTHLEQVTTNVAFRDMARFWDSVLYMHIVPQLLRHPDMFRGPVIEGDPYGKSFLDRLAKVNERTRKSWLKKIENALRVAVPQLEELSFTKDETGRPHIEAIYKHWRPRGARQREDQFSDGTLRMIGLLWGLLEGESLLLLEEPELSLNSYIVGKLPALMHKLQRQRKRQIILSTHSADLVSDEGIGLEEVLLFYPSQEGTQVTVGQDIKDARTLLESGLSIADVIMPQTAPSEVDQLTLFDE